ncbi:facilitated trehalose transporter Tret1-2 homolog [Bombyx mandarina]|uniref:Facilitated trehalose transporter Tret1-2 homolog n=1 Tax=Bombyx mandarina TaxID=7092 RepID=A0A6J2JJT5_BOMMA|nr:facilitated trehalose transporter Tret1-2 homolog [Bombyx mandarina]
MKGKLNQVFASFASGYGSFLMGFTNVWPSYTTELFKSELTPLLAPFSETHASLLGSLPSLGAMLGTAITGTLINSLGRKNGGIVLTLFNVLSWIIVELCSSPMLILVARFLAGISGGGLMVLAPIFISEFADDSIRGALASSTLFLYCVGILLSYIIGWFSTYHIIIWISLALSVTGVFLFLLSTESPVYYMRKRREEDARASIAHYKGLSPTSTEVTDELTRIKQQIVPAIELVSVTAEPDSKAEEAEKEKLNNDDDVHELAKNVSTIKQLFTTPSSLRGFLIVLTVISMQVFMGMVPVQVYAKEVFRQTDPAKSDLYTVLFALTLCSGTLVTATVADKAGRRVLLIASSALVSLCMASLGYLLQSKSASSWVTILVILIYCFAFMFGAGTVPYVLLAEVFVPEVQSFASMLIVEWVWFLDFVILAIFNYMTTLVGIHGVFYCFAAVALCNMAFSYVVVPETKGLSNSQIQEFFHKRKY